MLKQQNGLKIEEGKTYRSAVGDLVRVDIIDLKINTMKCYNISESSNAWHRIDAAIKDNKFKEEIR